MDWVGTIEEARERIRPHIRQTRLEQSDFYSEAGPRVFFKCENLQKTGSFKARGALNKILSLSADELQNGIVTASTGNHGAGVAYALSVTGTRGTVYASPNSNPSKIGNIERLGAAVEFVGDDPVEAEHHAKKVASETGAVYVSPYNDPDVIAGQGTIAAEMAEQAEHIDAVFVSVGGGGLISGIGAYLKSIRQDTLVVGCSAENSKVMHESIAAGSILDLPSLPTLSDGTAGGIDPGSVTFDLCREFVDEWIDVSEAEISASLREFIDAHHMLIEGSAAVAIAGFKRMARDLEGKNVLIVLCGANISLAKLGAVLSEPG